MIKLFEEDKKFKIREKNALENWIFASSDPRKYLEMATDTDLMGMFKGLHKDRRARNWARTMRKQLPADVRNLQEGGLVTETGMAMLHGTVPKPELVLDNQAASLFMKAADKISMIPIPAAQASGQVLTELQRAGSAAGAAGATVVVNNNASTTTSINSSQPMVLPSSPIYAGNPENSRLDAG